MKAPHLSVPPARQAALQGTLVLSVGCLVSCIFPDRDIRVSFDDDNEHAVRFLEHTALSAEAHCACQPERCGADADPQGAVAQCPLSGTSAQLPHFLDPNLPEYQFCSCSPEEFDLNALPATNLFVEDQDEDQDGQPLDAIFAAAMLDLPPDADPREYVAYTNLLDPNQSLPSYTDSYTALAIQRPEPQVRSLFFGDSNFNLDLCNAAGLGDLGGGWHTLTLIVSDRPWFTEEFSVPANGNQSENVVTVQHPGVPDIASGATYDRATFTFYCFTPEDAECSCASEDE